MKTLITALIIMLITGANSYSQATVKKYKSFEFTLFNLEKDTGKMEWEATTVLVVINHEKKKIKIYSKTEQDYDLLGHTKEYDKDNDADVLDFDAIDANGKRCDIRISKFRTPTTKHVCSIIITYGDYMLAYRLKDN